MRKVLLVDGSDQARRIAGLLKEAGYTVCTETNGLEAVGRVDPDMGLVILGAGIGDLDPSSIAYGIRSRCKKAPPVVVLSGQLQRGNEYISFYIPDQDLTEEVLLTAVRNYGSFGPQARYL